VAIIETVYMKKGLLLILLCAFSVGLQAQRDTVAISPDMIPKVSSAAAPDVYISIYPVPVRENYFTIKCDKEVSFVKITNIIGQDIFRAQYSDPQTITKIILDNPRRGIYLVTVIFSDGVRVVKKIMIEQVE
jgi:hypothetical protein